MIKNSQDAIQLPLVQGIQWNDHIIQLIIKLTKQYNLTHLVNIGAHIGTVALPLSKIINKVTAIEAYPPTYQYLLDNIKINNIDNIYPLNTAVGNNQDLVYFMSETQICPIEKVNRYINNTGGMHVFTDDEIKKNIRSAHLCDKKIVIRNSPFDRLCIEPFDLLLVDIEGSETNFLEGGRQQILDNQPIIIIEIWDNHKREKENMPNRREDVIEYITQLGYHLEETMDDDFMFIPTIKLDL